MSDYTTPKDIKINDFLSEKDYLRLERLFRSKLQAFTDNLYCQALSKIRGTTEDLVSRDIIPEQNSPTILEGIDKIEETKTYLEKCMFVLKMEFEFLDKMLDRFEKEKRKVHERLKKQLKLSDLKRR